MTEYFVDCANGNDAHAGTSAAEAWRTLEPVHAARLEPGDVVHLRRGCTWSGGLVINDDGEVDNPITFTAYGDGDRPTITHPGTYTRGIEIKANYIIIEVLRVQNVHADGVYVPSDYGYNIIRDLEITDAGSGITFNGHHNLATGNYIHDLHMIVNTPEPDNDDYGATGIKFRGRYNEASYNHIAHCQAPSHDYDTDGGGFELLGDTDESQIHHNWVENSKGFLEVGMGSAKNIAIHHNISLNNGRFHWIHLAGASAGEVENLRIDHNTIYEDGTNDHWVIFGFGGSPQANEIIIRNNIIYARQRKKIANYDGFTHNHNLYCLGPDVATGFSLGDAEALVDNLYFADANVKDFHLSPYSPAVRSGTDLGYTIDFNDMSLHTPPSIGAYEYIKKEDNNMTIIENLQAIAMELRLLAQQVTAQADEIDAQVATLQQMDDELDDFAEQVQQIADLIEEGE